jgi:hypothetical protein
VEGTVLDSAKRATHGSTARQAWQAGYATRRDWADGTHDLVGFCWAATSATRFVARDRRYWRRAPLRPTGWTVVLISRRDFDLHAARFDCRSPGCSMPASASAGQAWQ